MSKRRPLPARRRVVTRRISHHEPGVGDHRFLLSLSYYEDGGVGDAFASGHKEGSTMQHIMADACIVLSLALQYGCPPEVLAHSLGAVPKGEDGSTPASFIGTIVQRIISDSTIEKAFQDDECLTDAP